MRRCEIRKANFVKLEYSNIDCHAVFGSKWTINAPKFPLQDTWGSQFVQLP
jgi:hypothetical protein